MDKLNLETRVQDIATLLEKISKIETENSVATANIRNTQQMAPNSANSGNKSGNTSLKIEKPRGCPGWVQNQKYESY